MVFQKLVVVDTRGHLLGRLASLIAKELLMGQHVVCVRCEEINISGTFMRNKRTPPHPPAARSPALPVLRPSPPRGSGTVAKARRPWTSGTGTELGAGCGRSHAGPRAALGGGGGAGQPSVAPASGVERVPLCCACARTIADDAVALSSDTAVCLATVQ
jgi:hypothetical protein